jgi:tetraacyldisaccharide 4'-kinase
VLLAEHLTALPVIVGKDRHAAGRLAIERFGVDTIVLDDGFQHVQLARDLNILLLDARRPFGNGRLFPRGELRESPAALARADAIVLTRWESEATTAPLAEAIGRVNLPLFRSQHTPRDLQALSGAQILPLSALKGQRIAAFCGIAVPNHFRLTLQRLGADIVSFVAFPDHHPYTPGEVRQLGLIAKRQEAGFIVTTEKDGIRLRHLPAGAERMWELRIHATVVEPEAVWQSYLVNGLGDQAGACL